MKLKPYPEYKDSVEWIGEIPKNWNCSKIKHIADVKISNVDKKSKPYEPDVLLCNYTDVYNNEFIIDNLDFMKATASIEQIKKLSLKKGDVIITKDSEAADDIAVPALVKDNFDNVVCGYHLALIRPDVDIQGDYLFRLLESKQINDQFVIAANGVTRFGISTYPIKNSYLMVPSIEEQEKISSFLDKKTSEIDLTIEKDTRLIELLKEKRTSLINRVVTKGLDPTVKMKDSGAEWIGEIPEDWEMMKFKRVSSKITQGPNPDLSADVELSNYKVLKTKDLYDDGIRYNFTDYLSEDAYLDCVNSRLEDQDILITIVGHGSIGKINIFESQKEHYIFTRAIALVRPLTNQINPIFIKYFFQSKLGKELLYSLIEGSTGQEVIKTTKLSDLKIIRPPIEYQNEIIEILDIKTQNIDLTIQKIQDNIELLEEYKKSLIHHVVTGKVDVREVAV
ncbi:restriction endonuclease subunit S [Methanobacterium subterraneum]|uniref:Type I restriction modification DNA specificity domain-containing protein n=1 Tax=Methanobacterium subterraneum TaxID=59277 RepID=A0A7K4DM40_9EURY|nr:restriction endonuclease subunit S [Methanobacterium subterraneum]NMO09492.1 hypothetical protein [Methanobacterium subterraneum]